MTWGSVVRPWHMPPDDFDPLARRRTLPNVLRSGHNCLQNIEATNPKIEVPGSNRRTQILVGSVVLSVLVFGISALL